MTEDPILKPPVKTRRHIGQAIRIRGVVEEVRRVDGVNAKIAVFLTNIVGSMWCAVRVCDYRANWPAACAEAGRRGYHRLDCTNVPSIGAVVSHYGRAERTERGERYPFAAHLRRHREDT